jgi:hypothetical protein
LQTRMSSPGFPIARLAECQRVHGHLDDFAAIVTEVTQSLSKDKGPLARLGCRPPAYKASCPLASEMVDPDREPIVGR